MAKTSILIVRPEGDDTSPADQALGAQLCAGSEIELHERRFRRDVPDDIERQLALWSGKVAGVIGAMQVAESQRLAKLAEKMQILCFVANNNPAVWKSRNIFHIGFPTPQTTTAIAAELVQKTNSRRYLMLHDSTEFQTRVATTMQARLRELGMDARTIAHSPGDPLHLRGDWKPEVIYVVFSSERKARTIIETAGEMLSDTPLVFGRSLLRESFLQFLDGRLGEFWFVDTNFRQPHSRTESQWHFIEAMSSNGVAVPTTSHAFGWDCMKFCAAALKAGGGDPRHAIDYLESGTTLEGAGGPCAFTPDNHNGRHGPGPTILSRWSNGRFEEIQALRAAGDTIS
jgi:ABC-type branched-subunit amino acid transport system substrate-binding protein